MKSLSRVGLGLSFVFLVLLVALMAELYYLLWWKKRVAVKPTNTDQNGIQIPPMCLFTIAEETKEDLEPSEEGNHHHNNLRELLQISLDTTNASPCSNYFTPPLTPLSEAETDSKSKRIMRVPSSPPPKFKFLRDAEEKLIMIQTRN